MNDDSEQQGHGVSSASLSRYETLISEGFEKLSWPGIPNPLITWPDDVADILHGAGARLKHPAMCDGVHCRDLKNQDAYIKGLRFRCLDCDNTDFCEQCLASKDNDHSQTHGIFVLYKQKNCHGGLSSAERKRASIGADYKEWTANCQMLRMVAAAETCSLCATVWKAFVLQPPPIWPPIEDTITLRLRSPAQNLYIFTVLTNESTDVVENSSSKTERAKEHSVQICWGIKRPRAEPQLSISDKPPFRRVALDSASEDCLQLARQWLQTCCEQHPQCNLTMRSALPTRVIEIQNGDESRIYVRNGSELDEPYIALSYCWGNDPNPVETTSHNLERHMEEGLLLEGLPHTVRDAVRVANFLGTRYLWIDRFCIVQDDADDWTREAASMCDAYANALLTISADRSDSVYTPFLGEQEYAKDDFVPIHASRYLRKGSDHQHLAGVDSSKTQPNHRRAWTMQERLMSKRVLHFTSNEIVWECDTIVQCECGLESEQSQSRLTSAISGRVSVYEQWAKTVEDYTTRALTFQEDKFHAISGLAAHMRRIIEEVTGKEDMYLAGLWMGNLASGLSWLTPTRESWNIWLRNNEGAATEVRTIRKDDDAKYIEDYVAMLEDRRNIKNRRTTNYVGPTWSWASMRGPIEYFHTLPHGEYHSYINIMDTNLTRENANDTRGQLGFGSSITLSGHVVGSNDASGNLKMMAFSGGFDTGNPLETLWMEETYLMYDDEEYGAMIQIEADDPVNAVHRFGGQAEVSVMILLVGTHTITVNEEGRVAVQGMPTCKFIRSQKKPKESAPDSATLSTSPIVPGELEERTEHDDDAADILPHSPPVHIREIAYQGTGRSDGSSTTDHAEPKTEIHNDETKVLSYNEPGHKSKPDTSEEASRSNTIEDALQQLTITSGNPYEKGGEFDDVWYWEGGRYGDLSNRLVGHEAFYLALVPSKEHPGAWERLGCFHTGIVSEGKAIMSELFQRAGRKESVILV